MLGCRSALPAPAVPEPPVPIDGRDHRVTTPPVSTLSRIPRGVWALGVVSLLMDVSSEMIHALLPLYLAVGLGTPMVAVGIIEGIAEATAAITKVFSGALSDRLGARKWLAAAGYGLAASTKPVFPLATSVSWLVAARFVDRIGKGIRGAPRDALVADLTPPDLHGAAFGLRQALDTVGAFLGPLVAILLMWLTAENFRAVFWCAALPAAAATLLIVLAVRDPPRSPGLRRVRAPLSRAELARLPRAYWAVVGVAAVFTLARFSEAFLVLRAADVGLLPMWAPAVMVLMSVVYAAAAYPAGVVADRIDRRWLLAVGLAVLVAADLALGFAGGLPGVAAGVALWGLHMGLTQGLLAAMVADTAPAELRGTAFGMFNLVTGGAMLAASVLAGLLWDVAGPRGTFLAGAGFALAAMVAVMAIRSAPAAADHPA
jgi:MFS family permease